MAMHNGRNRVADRHRVAVRPASVNRMTARKNTPPPGALSSDAPAFPKDVVVPLRFNAAILAPPVLKSPPQSPKSVSPKTVARKSKAPTPDAAPPKPERKRAASQKASSGAEAPKKRQRKSAADKPADKSVAAIHLPDHSEPLVTPATPQSLAAEHRQEAFSRSPSPEASMMPPIARNRAIAAPPLGLWAAIDAWLSSAKKLLRAGFVVKKPGPRRPAAPSPMPPRVPPLPSQPAKWLSRKQSPPLSLREQSEITQLRAENRRLRLQMETLIAQQRLARAKEPIDS